MQPLLGWPDDLFARFLSQSHRALRLRFAGPVGVHLDGVVLVQDAHIREGLNEGLLAHLTCLTTRSDLTAQWLMGQPIELQIVSDLGRLKRVCGVIAKVVHGQSDGALSTLQITVQDALSLMAQRSLDRTFLNQSLPDILRSVMDGWLQQPALARCFKYELLGLDDAGFAPRACTVQTGQSERAFLQAQLAREGCNYFIRPGPDGPDGTPQHVLVIFDQTAYLCANSAGAVRYHRMDGTEPRDTLCLLSPEHSLTSGAVRWSSWDYESGSVDQAEDRSADHHGEAGDEWASALQQHRVVLPHAGDDADDFRRLVRIEQQRHKTRSARLLGVGGVREQAVGEYNRIDGHANLGDLPEQREYITVHLQHWARNNLPKDLQERAGHLLQHSRQLSQGWVEQPPPPCMPSGAPASDASQPPAYLNRFVAIQRSRPIRPTWRPQDQLPPAHLCSATVIGSDEQPVWTDGLARIKVAFHGFAPQSASAWVRVHSPWAGDGFGQLFIPRPGMEVSIGFEHGDPSRPVVLACRWGEHNRPARFDHLGSLPENAALSGIVTRELGGGRQQQLRFNDTGGQISVQLASDHAASQLNLGDLSQPMRQGQTAPRGEGMELRTDAAAALRAGQGVLVSAGPQEAEGPQMQRDELLGLAQALQGVAQHMGELAQTHLAGPAQAQALTQMLQRLQDWEQGSSTEPEGSGGRSPMVAIHAQAGTSLTSQDNLLLGAQTQTDVMAIQHLQAIAGQNLLLRSGALMAAFAQQAMHLVAQLALRIESQSDSIQLSAAKNIELTAGQKIIIQAPEVEIIAQGGATRWASGSIVEQASGAFVVKAASFAQSSGGDGVPKGVQMPSSQVGFDQQVVLQWIGTDEPMPQQRYRVTTEAGQTFEGRTDDLGFTERFPVPLAFGSYRIEPLDP